MSMALLIALSLGVLTACGVYLVLRARLFDVVLGLTLFSYAVNLFLFLSGRIGAKRPPIVSDEAMRMADPLPQALTLTAIVISFAMTGYLVALMLRAVGETRTDHVDGYEPHRRDGEEA